MMRTINDVASGELRWVDPTNELSYELLTGAEEVVGRLRLDAKQRGDSDTANERWTLTREGFWHPRVTVRAPGSDADVAIFHTSWKKGGILELDGGRWLRLRLPTLTRWKWTWTDMHDRPLVHLGHGFLMKNGQVTIEPDAAESPDVPLLAVLGWYLLVIWAMDQD
jgi:hypothetical protein